MMKSDSWKSLKQDFTKRQIADAFFGGLFYATLFYAPFAILLIEMVTVYMYLLTLFMILIIISLFVYMLALHYFWRKSLMLKKAEEAEEKDRIIISDIKKLFLRNMLIVDGIILIMGIVFILVFVPILWV